MSGGGGEPVDSASSAKTAKELREALTAALDLRRGYQPQTPTE